jgi:SOS-response transcriptional repressor LexA
MSYPAGKLRVSSETPPTRKQERVLWLMRKDVREHGVPPSLEQLAKAMGLAGKGSVVDHIRMLERRGLVKKGHRGFWWPTSTVNKEQEADVEKQ